MPRICWCVNPRLSVKSVTCCSFSGPQPLISRLQNRCRFLNLLGNLLLLGQCSLLLLRRDLIRHLCPCGLQVAHLSLQAHCLHWVSLFELIPVHLAQLG